MFNLILLKADGLFTKLELVLYVYICMYEHVVNKVNLWLYCILFSY